MSWSDYKAPTAEIPLGGGATGTVRGLNLEDIGLLLTDHLEPISKAMQLYNDSKSDVFTKARFHAFIVQMSKQFPTLAVEVISIAADEPSLKEKKVALGVQVAALSEIVRLTLEEVGGLGNLLLALGKQVRAVTPNSGDDAVSDLNDKSPSSIGVAAKT